MAVNAKLGVDLSSFEAGIRSGQAILKGLNAEMKATEAEFKATGNSEQKLANQTKTLNSQMQVQKGIADQAAEALKKLDAAGIQPTDAAYQKLYATMMNANAGMNEAQAQLNALGESAQTAATGAEQLTTSVNKIGKKISLDQVLSGINSITKGLESAAQKAVQLGETIWNSIMDSAKWADDTATQALMFGIDVETYQRMQKLVTNGMDTTVEAMLKSQSKLKKGIGSESKAAIEALQELGVAWDETIGAGKYGDVKQVRDTMEVFWEAGQKILAMKDDPNAQEDMAQALFGRSWRELVPLFDKYKSVEEYNEALQKTKINSEEEVNALAELNDKVNELKGNFNTLANEVMAQLAPALTDAATALNGLLESVLEYLETPEGKEMLKSLGDSVSELFSGMKNINAEDVVNGFKDAFDKVMNVLNWIVDNKDTVVTALEGIFGFWATLKVSEGVGTILKVINGLKDLAGIGGSGAAGAASWVSTAMTTASQAVANYLGNPVLQSVLPAIGDWFTYNSTIGHWLMGTETPADTLEGIKQNASTFAEDWNNNVLFRGLMQGLTGGFMYGTGGEGGFDENEELIRQDLQNMMDAEPFDFVAEPVVSEDAAESIAAQIGTVPVYVSFVGGAGAGGGKYSYLAEHANGLPLVPYDGYLARLHKGERVVPAREVQSRSYNSNLYVESMYMNNGTDAAGLAAAMAAAQRRTMSGFGS